MSAIVPVYNPGDHIDKCIETLVDQSLDPREYEVIFVDDGSTDATPGRLDRLAEDNEHVRVEHIPNSGWPGRPRNVGIDMARGEFVYFVDNDDFLGHEALERLYERALSADADVVVGKVVGHGKPVPRALFTENRDDVTLEWPQLVRLLTPHKLFRRSLLDDHGIRFPEGRRRLEDHMFTVHAYLHARRISVLADYPCYYWVRHRSETANASYQAFDPRGYYGNVREVLDLVIEHTEPGELRERLLAHWYRGKMLGRVGGRRFPLQPPQFRRAVYDEVSALARERYGPEVERFLTSNLRVRSRLLRDGTYDDLSALAHWEAALRAGVTIGTARFEAGGTCLLPFEGRLVGERDAPVLFERREGRLLWVPPDELRGKLPDEVLDWTSSAAKASTHLIIRSRRDMTDFVLPAERHVEWLPAGDGFVTPVVRGEARIEAGRAAAGSSPRPGRWEVLASVSVCGLYALGRARSRMGTAYDVRIGKDGAVERVSRRSSAAAARVARRAPVLARVWRRVTARRATAGAR